MDFYIADTDEELEQEKHISKQDVFIRNIITFIDFNTFQKNYLSSCEYNDSAISNLWLFSLQYKSYRSDNYREDKKSNLR